MTADPVSILGLPKPAWVTEDVGMLYDMARRFMSDEIAPHYDAYEKNEMVDRARLGKGRRGRAALRLDAGGIWRCRRHVRA